VSSAFDNTDRFLRATDAGRVRRNQRHIAIEKILAVLRNILVTVAVLAGLGWLFLHTQSDARFAVRQLQITGAVHTPRALLDAKTRPYVGLNLFRIDIARVQQDLESLSWIKRVDIEKKLPGTLRILITEREPVALLRDRDRLVYIDGEGRSIAELSANVGDDELPVISHAAGTELGRTIALLQTLRTNDAALYSRLGEVKPIAPRGFAIFDRELQMTVYVNGEDAISKWRDLYAVTLAEHLAAGSMEYADLRFADRLVVKPVRSMTVALAPVRRPTAAEITN